VQYKALSSPPSLPTLHAYIQTYLPTSPPSGLRNGPTYVALALWLNGPPCKWSGVEEWSHPSRLIGAPISAITTIFTSDALPDTTLPIWCKAHFNFTIMHIVQVYASIWWSESSQSTRHHTNSPSEKVNLPTRQLRHSNDRCKPS